MTSQQIQNLSQIGLALSKERDMSKLLEMILAESRIFTNCDAGTFYRVSKNNFIPGKYSVIGFLTETGFKTIVLLQHEVRYLDKIGNRILSSIDVLKEEKK